MDLQKIYTMILNKLPLGFSVVDQDGVIVDFNSAAEQITGYSRDEVLGRSHLDILHGTSDAHDCPLYSRTLTQQEQTIAADSVIRKKSGELITITVSAFPLFDEENRFIGGFELFRDISERRRLERERGHILSMFAHDMKNPVMTAMGFTSRILTGKSGPLTDLQKDGLGLVIEELETLQELVMDFLEFSRFESKGKDLAKTCVNIEQIIMKHLERIRPSAAEKNITVHMTPLQTGNPEVQADEHLIERVIVNLLDNAVKYTNSGGSITVTVSAGETEILVRIRDTGVGIPEKHMPYIFDAFYRAHRDARGSGLGLSIAKMIISAHGGRIWADSVVGEGSTFSFSLPK